MKFIKEYVQGSEKHCVIRANRSYNKLFSFVLEMTQIAKQDFPNLTDDEITIIIYGGDRYKGTIGIEFKTKNDIPSDYKEILSLELTIT